MNHQRPTVHEAISIHDNFVREGGQLLPSNELLDDFGFPADFRLPGDLLARFTTVIDRYSKFADTVYAENTVFANVSESRLSAMMFAYFVRKFNEQKRRPTFANSAAILCMAIHADQLTEGDQALVDDIRDAANSHLRKSSKDLQRNWSVISDTNATSDEIQNAFKMLGAIQILGAIPSWFFGEKALHDVIESLKGVEQVEARLLSNPNTAGRFSSAIEAYLECTSIGQSLDVFAEFSPQRVVSDAHCTAHRGGLRNAIVQVTGPNTKWQNPLHQKVMLNLLLPITFLPPASNQDVSELTIRMVSNLQDVLHSYRELDVKAANKILKAISGAGVDCSQIPFGYVFHLADMLDSNLASLSEQAIRERLKEGFKQNKDFVTRLQASDLHRFFQRQASLLSDVDREEVRGYWSRLGYIVDQQVAADSFGMKRDERTTADAAQVEDVDLETRINAAMEFRYPKELREAKWTKSFQDDYMMFRTLTKDKYFENEIEYQSLHYLKKCIDRKLDNKSVSTLLKLKQARWPQIVRDMILRRIVLVFWNDTSHVVDLAITMGYTDKVKADGNALQKQLIRIGLPIVGVLDEWKTSDRVYDEERKWAEGVRKKYGLEP